MRNWSFIIFIFLVFYGCTAELTKAQITAQGMPTTDPYTWNFGRVKEGAILKHEFVFKNTSDKFLKIMDITTSCSCTVSKAKKNILAPGEAIPIEVQFKSKGYSKAVEQFVYVHTDNIDDSVIKFIIKADVVK
jgi:hypothetical protein